MFNYYDYYITPEEYKIAEKNGISKRVLDRRIRDLAWDKEKAINTPKARHKNYPKEIKELANKNGVSIATLKSRVNQLGWDMVKAATTPVMDKRKNIYKAIPKVRKYPKEILEIVKQNGIPVKCFYNRITKYKWSIEKAATTPVMTSSEIGTINKEKNGKVFDYIFCKKQHEKKVIL
ncbi:hypothetical protein FDG04_02295 [Clostridium sporogenes]|uniref:hypothetical protein n=1 Tax=Clostridium sporogenes TaxID=1509 RepID=UPI0013D14B9F|nr:hypothetical protein [Clostridium sporogenes]NFQ84163.1 hypothetical protein [Clostridium sporogenes]